MRYNTQLFLFSLRIYVQNILQKYRCAANETMCARVFIFITNAYHLTGAFSYGGDGEDIIYRVS